MLLRFLTIRIVLIFFFENKYLPVNGANVVETPAGDKTARRGIGTGHDP